MKALLAIAAALFTWYMAGMYRSAALMVLFLTEALLLAVLFFQPRRLRRQVRASFLPLEAGARRGAPLPCRLLLENRRGRGAGTVCVTLRLRYPRLDAPPSRRRLRCGVDEQGGGLDFQLTAPYCGLLEAEIMRVRFSDLLRIFSARGPKGGTVQLPVLPPERALRLELASSGPEGQEEAQHPGQNGDGQDLRQLREYRAGDPVRRIHWNQSARSHIIWFKEHEREEEPWMELLLNTSESRGRTAAVWSAFYEVLSALVLGLLQAGACVRVTWLEAGAEAFSDMELQDAGELPALLTTLYLTGFSRTGEAFRSRANQRLLELGDRYMELDLDLVWRHSGVKLYQFSPEHLETELGQGVFLL